jgi:hypothetical protein
MRSTLFLAVGIVGGCLSVLAIVFIICSYAKRNVTAIINAQPIPPVEVDIVGSEMLTSEYSTIGGEPSEDINNVLVLIKVIWRWLDKIYHHKRTIIMMNLV